MFCSRSSHKNNPTNKVLRRLHLLSSAAAAAAAQLLVVTYSNNNNNSTTALVYSFAKTQSAWYSRKERAPYLVRLHLSRKPGRNRGCVDEKKTGERRVNVRFSPTSKIIKTTVTPLTPGSIRSGLGPYPGARRSYRSSFTRRRRRARK